MTMAEMKNSNFSENEIAENENENKNTTTRSSKFRVTIEPALFMGVTAMYVTYLSKQNLLLEKVCRVNLNYSDDICDALAERNSNATPEYDEVLDEVEHYVTGINTWSFIVDHAFPIAFCLVMGAWSDKHGRKPLLLSSQMGYFFGAVTLILNVYFENWSAEIMVISFGIIHGIGGASVALNLATIAYIGDISTPETKTQRMGLAIIAFTMATPIGSAVAAPIYQAVGYYGTFGIVAGCHLVVIFYLLFFVKETRDTKPHRATIIRDLFDLRQIVYAIHTVFKPREGNLRSKLILLVCIPIFVTFYFGELSILYLFLIEAFNWTYSQYGYFSTFRFLVNIIGMAFTLGIISYKLGVSDPMVGILGCFSQILASICMFLSPYFGAPWLFYLAPVIDFLNGAVTIVNKSMVTKTVPNHELGQISAVMSVVEALVPVLANPAYNQVYQYTLDSEFPGTVFLVTAGCMVICIIAFIILYIDHRRTPRMDPKRLTSINSKKDDIIQTTEI